MEQGGADMTPPVRGGFGDVGRKRKQTDRAAKVMLRKRIRGMIRLARLDFVEYNYASAVEYLEMAARKIREELL